MSDLGIEGQEPTDQEVAMLEAEEDKIHPYEPKYKLGEKLNLMKRIHKQTKKR